MMASRKRVKPGPYSYDDDEDYVPGAGVKYSSTDDSAPAKKKAHTLDSDEEEEEDTNPQDVLKEDEITGQEEQTVHFDGETTITPFNMKEELEEGHFDNDGYYHLKKESNNIKDAWLDDIDWIKVKHEEDNVDKYAIDSDLSGGDDSDSEMRSAAPLQEGAPSKETTKDVYAKILELLKPGETVAKALKRLGGGKKLTSAQKWKLKKQKKAGESEGSSDGMTQMLLLTELTSKLMDEGDMNVFEETYESIGIKVKPSKPASPSFDMFSDGPQESAPATGSKETDASIDGVRWELKWENTDEAKIEGPYPSTQMMKWQDSGHFEKGAYVRKVDSGGSWYRTDRLDFELYC